MRTTPGQRLLGVLFIVGTVVGLFFLAGLMLAIHPTWQRHDSVVVDSAIPNPEISISFENLAVHDSAGNYFTLTWNGFVAQGQHIKVWVIVPDGYEANTASQTPYPHQYHILRVFAFVILCIIGCCLFGYGLNLSLRR